jgi:hypothetical protein
MSFLTIDLDEELSPIVEAPAASLAVFAYLQDA